MGCCLVSLSSGTVGSQGNMSRMALRKHVIVGSGIDVCDLIWLMTV